jgi:hypothetical protein
MSMRRAVARPAGAGDLMDEVRAYEQSDSLSESLKLVLRLHDVFLFDPRRLSAALRADALARFSPDQMVELTLKFLFWTTNRPVVVLGGDAPHDAERLTSFHYGENGEYIVHSPK